MSDRRSFLRGLGTLPLIGGVTLDALAITPAAAAEPDAAIITMAAHVKALAEHEDWTLLRVIDLEARAFVSGTMPPRQGLAKHAAERLHKRVNGRLINAANDLGEMRPTTLKGLIAKASAVRLNKDGYPDEDWAEYLSAFIIEDLGHMGGVS